MKFTTFKLNKDFRRLYGRGKCIIMPQVVFYYKKNNLDYCRIGISVSKKIGTAVKRNRAKRIITASFRELLPMIDGGYDFVFAGRVKTTLIKSSVLFSKLKKAFAGEGIIKQ